MTCIIDPCKAEVTVFADSTVLDTVDEEGGVARGAELRGEGVVEGEGDGFAAEPVAYLKKTIPSGL